MAKSLEDRILVELKRAGAGALKPKALARKLNVPADAYPEFKRLLKRLVQAGKLEVNRGKAVRPPTVHPQVVGVFRSRRGGGGIVRPRPGQGIPAGDIAIDARSAADAATGDVVLVQLLRRGVGDRLARGRILDVVERAASSFVGTYYTEQGEGFVRVDGGTFHEDIYVGDAGAKGAKVGDKVVFEMLRFPSPTMLGEGVIVEILGPRGQPGVDVLSVIRQFRLPDTFSEEALAEARAVARQYEHQTPDGTRVDLTQQTVVTIDPPDAHDFDDAVHVARDAAGHWRLEVHIADVATFVKQGGALDREARLRGTSVYLPGRVLPMLPEIVSNGLASLQEHRLRYAKTVVVDFDPEGRVTGVDFQNSVIRVSKRLTYDAVMHYFEHGKSRAKDWPADVCALLDRMRELARLLRQRRRERGMLELSMPEAVLAYDDQGKIVGAHYTVEDESHRVIEEFMLTANEAVASKLTAERIAFPRRIHEIPDPMKLKAFAEFVKSFGIAMHEYRSRFELQRVLREVMGKPERHAVHYALLRSLKEAIYSPEEDGHYALASEVYCHFTSPIRRYPDLIVHRMLDQWLRTGRAGYDYTELASLGAHCSFTERRAEKAERELVKVKLLDYLSHRVGLEMDMIITNVEDYGFFAQGTEIPAEGLVHVRTLADDHYVLDRATHSLVGRRSGRRFRLGDPVRCILRKVDLERRQVDLEVVEKPTKSRSPSQPRASQKDEPRAKRLSQRAPKPAQPSKKRKRKS